jgi:cytochrome c551/c552
VPLTFILALQQAIVGPAYRDVAAGTNPTGRRSPTQPGAFARAASANGAAAPIPSFSSLSESDVKALAAFVVAQ